MSVIARHDAPDTPHASLWVLAEIGGQINTARSWEQLQQVLRTSLRWLLDCDRSTLAIRAEGSPTYRLYDITASSHQPAPFVDSVPITEGWSGRVFTDGKPLYFDDVGSHESLSESAEIKACTDARAVMALPLRIGERVAGCLLCTSCTANTYRGEVRSIAHLLALAIAGQIGTIEAYIQMESSLRETEVARCELQKLTAKFAYQASHDPLTDLPNRRELEQRLQAAVYSARAGVYDSVICVLDLDQFKSVNDQCGHAAGDALLREIAVRISRLIRNTDTFARTGGDEFALLMSSCKVQDALPVVQTIHDAIAALVFVWDNCTFTISGSIGVAEIAAGDVSPDEPLRRADAACYAAKNAGRNTVYIHNGNCVPVPLG